MKESTTEQNGYRVNRLCGVRSLHLLHNLNYSEEEENITVIPVTDNSVKTIL